MKNKLFKKLVSSLVTACLLFSSFGVAMGASETPDIKGHWAESQMSAWMDKGLIKGYEDGKFKPGNIITRAEFIALINRSFGFTEETSISFSDVLAGNWAYPEVKKAVKAGYITGYADGTIGASKPISRQEVAVIIDRLLGLSNTASKETAFTDSSTIALWAKESVDVAVAKGILKGYAEDKSFKPSKFITRAEAVVTLDRAVAAKATVYSAAGTYGPATGTETIHGDVVINVTGITLQNTIINGNLLFAAGINEGDAKLNNVSVKGITRVEGGGVNSIYFRNSTLPTIIVDKKNGNVRIVIEGSATVREVIVLSPVIIQSTEAVGAGFSKVTLSELLPADSKVTLKGTFDTLNVKGTKIQVDIPVGSVKEVNVESTATGMTLNLGADAKIVSLVLDAVSTILGTGTIETATLSSVAKAGTTFEKQPTKVLAKVEGGTAIATPAPAPTTPSGSTPSSSIPSTGSSDTTVPTLSRVTVGQISVGDNVYGTSNESGYLYLVPATTIKTMTHLNDSVNASLGEKLAVTASVYSTISTADLIAGTYVVYAVDSSNNISAISAEIIVVGLQLTIADPALLTLTKGYDGTNTAVVIANSLIGVVSGDIVTVSAVATYNNAEIGTGKIITVVYSLGGANAAKYIVPANYTVNSGVITNTQLTIGDPALTLIKGNDGTTTAAVTPGILVGVASNEDVTVSAVANYDTAIAGINKTITVVYTLSGTDAAKYIAPVNYTVGTGEIEKDQITRSKVYDGTTTAAVTPGLVSGIIDGDDVTVSATGSYDDKTVGSNKTISVVYSLSGVDAGNYTPPNPYTVSKGVITALQLTIAAPSLINSKVHDGTATAVVTAGTLVGVIGNDEVTVSAVATYSSAAVGTDKTITVVYKLGGADAANYVTPVDYTVSTGVITAP